MNEATTPRHTLRVTMSRCPNDGELAVPADTLGCRRCGNEPSHLETMTVDARGLAEAVITVNRPIGGHEAPYRFGEIRLDAGPMVRALCSPAVSAGTRVVGIELDESILFEIEEAVVDA